MWRSGVGIALVGAALMLSGCGALRNTPPTVTPIVITATPPPPLVPVVATETPSATPVLAATNAALLPTVPPHRTATPTPRPPITMTPTFTPTTTDTPVTPGALGFAPVGGLVGAGGAVSAGGCANPPSGIFGAVYQSDPNLAAALGCPIAPAPSSVASAYQPFQNGVMIWVASLGVLPQGVIYALYNNGTYQRFNDTWREGVDPVSSGAQPPPGLVEPVRGFGKVWRENGGVRDGLGWGTAGEAGGSAQVLAFERGEMINVSQAGQTYIFIAGAPGTWTAR